MQSEKSWWDVAVKNLSENMPVATEILTPGSFTTAFTYDIKPYSTLKRPYIWKNIKIS